MILTQKIRRAGSLFSMLALLAMLTGLVPATAARAQADCQNFSETGHKVCGRFLEYWKANGGLAQQGYPISDEMKDTSPADGKTYTMQYFERAVFELHPENKAPYDVLLSLLGRFELDRRYSSGAAGQKVSTAAGAKKFAETGHTVGGKFLDYWTKNGGLAQQGYPLTDELTEVSELDGKTYTVQYFERAVFESHPENAGSPYETLLSQLGRFWYDRWIGPVVVNPTGTGALNASGATFPQPIYAKWFQLYQPLNPNATFNYQGTGSGAGITAITQKTVDFAGSDALLTDAQFAAAPGLEMIPTVAGAVVLIYNVPGLATGATLDGATVANIFLGTITKWNDPAIAALNPGVSLPDTDIAIAHRSDGSGTTNIFTNYLSAVSSTWNTQVGAGTAVNWPVGIGGRGNPGVAAAVQQTPGSIGYVELAYATQNKLNYAKLKNKSGNVVEASPASASAAARGVTIPEDFRLNIVNSGNADAWPIAGFTYILLYKDLSNIATEGQARALVEFLYWATHRGQDIAPKPVLYYAPLPTSVVKKVEEKLLALTYKGAKLLGK